MRHLNLSDRIFSEFQHCLNTISNKAQAQRTSPAQNIKNNDLNQEEQTISSGCMRVNHTGEVCAQALYRGQALATHNPELHQHLLEAANEEHDHLAWCEQRLQELNTHTSYLNPLWYITSFMIGFSTARISDAISLGFVEETEKQVIEHLEQHQKRISKQDQKSLNILDTMRSDEARHANNAKTFGAQELPLILKCLMRLQSKVMTTTAYYI